MDRVWVGPQILTRKRIVWSGLSLPSSKKFRTFCRRKVSVWQIFISPSIDDQVFGVDRVSEAAPKCAVGLMAVKKFLFMPWSQGMVALDPNPPTDVCSFCTDGTAGSILF